MRRALGNIPGFEVNGDPISPIVLISFASKSGVSLNREEIMVFFEKAALTLQKEKKILVAVPTFIPSEKHPPMPSLRVLITRHHTAETIKNAAEAIRAVLSQRLGELKSCEHKA